MHTSVLGRCLVCGSPVPSKPVWKHSEKHLVYARSFTSNAEAFLQHVAKVIACAGVHTVDPPLKVYAQAPVPAPAVAKIKEAYLRHPLKAAVAPKVAAHPPLAALIRHAIAAEPAPHKPL